jgi:hypothetical protein
LAVLYREEETATGTSTFDEYGHYALRIVFRHIILAWAGCVAYLSRWLAKASVRDKQKYDSHAFLYPFGYGLSPDTETDDTQ